ncbi:hypothetical protein B0H17DRAFT_1204227 [Mycena rosella]|uniref:Uncharacterized protein n=1 Tax=Mycena rosella TaxID=1033263 RepID=A0AAD7GBG1_MYCRO|nr:hypothetical protein B0H17DRAFT_1204227 [Mycena rosella]
MTSGHVLFFTTTDGNSKLREEIEDKCAGGYPQNICLSLNGGLDPDDLRGWLYQYETGLKVQLKDEERNIIEITTGNVPLLLSMVFRAVKPGDSFNKTHLRLDVDVHGQSSPFLQELMKQWPENLNIPDMRQLLLAAMNNNR